MAVVGVAAEFRAAGVGDRVTWDSAAGRLSPVADWFRGLAVRADGRLPMALVVLLLLGGAAVGLLAARPHPVSPIGGRWIVASEGVAHPAWTVAEGDTLWGIAETTAPAADPRETIERIRELNGSQLQSLRPGQVLLMPRQQ